MCKLWPLPKIELIRAHQGREFTLLRLSFVLQVTEVKLNSLPTYLNVT